MPGHAGHGSLAATDASSSGTSSCEFLIIWQASSDFSGPILIGDQPLHPFPVPILFLLHGTSIRSLHRQVRRHLLPLQLTEDYLLRWRLILSHTFGPFHIQLQQKRCHHRPPSSIDQMAQEPLILRDTVCLVHLPSIPDKPHHRHILTFALLNVNALPQ